MKEKKEKHLFRIDFSINSNIKKTEYVYKESTEDAYKYVSEHYCLHDRLGNNNQSITVTYMGVEYYYPIENIREEVINTINKSDSDILKAYFIIFYNTLL